MSYLLRRILYAFPIAIGATIICFSLIYLGPADPVVALTPDNAGPEEVDRIRKLYGFDQPVPVQYVKWLGRVATGDFGRSMQSNRAVVSELMPAIGNTLILAVVATVLAFTLAFSLGIVAAYHARRWPDRLFTSIAVTGLSIPPYWLSIVLIIVFAVELDLLPAMGMGPGSSREWTWDAEHLRYLVLPTIAVAATPLGIIMRTTRACVLEMLHQEFVQALHAKGISSRRVLMHVLRNASPTVLAATGIQFGQLLGGSILVETVFAWPGAGYLLNESIYQRDMPMLQGIITVLALIFVIINLLVDLLQSWLDPRIRRG